MATRFGFLGSVDDRAQRISCSTSRRLRCSDLICTSVENADSHSHVELNGNNFFRAILLICGYDDAKLNQNLVTGRDSDKSLQLESFFKSLIGLEVYLLVSQGKAEMDFLQGIGHLQQLQKNMI